MVIEIVFNFNRSLRMRNSILRVISDSKGDKGQKIVICMWNNLLKERKNNSLFGHKKFNCKNWTTSQPILMTYLWLDVEFTRRIRCINLELHMKEIYNINVQWSLFSRNSIWWSFNGSNPKIIFKMEFIYLENL